MHSVAFVVHDGKVSDENRFVVQSSVCEQFGEIFISQE